MCETACSLSFTLDIRKIPETINDSIDFRLRAIDNAQNVKNILFEGAHVDIKYPAASLAPTVSQDSETGVLIRLLNRNFVY